MTATTEYDPRADLRARLAAPVAYHRADDPRIAAIQALVAAAGPAAPVDVVTWFVGLISQEIDLDLVARRAEVELGNLVAFAFPDGEGATL